MIIGEAIPDVFRRNYPVVQPSTEMILVLTLLRFQQIDALPIEFKVLQKKRQAVFGYSCLSKLLEMQPEDYRKFLKLPAKTVALPLSTIDADNKISDLLRIFQKTKFGFAWVESERLGGFASLRDLLNLYNNDTIETGLRLAELASPIFSLPRETDIKTVLREMFSRRIRRIFVEGTTDVVTDRKIIGHLFSSSRLEETSSNPKTLLDVRLGDLETFSPEKVRGTSSAKKGAKLMADQRDECLVCEKGVLTPWDLVMKPLSRGALKILA